MAQQRYQAFVMDGIGGKGPWDQVRGQLYLGSDIFVARHQPGRVINEISRGQTHAHRATLATIFGRKGRQDEKIAIAYRQHGYRLREIAEYLGVHYATVSRHLRSAEQANG
jgi:putative transposase